MISKYAEFAEIVPRRFINWLTSKEEIFYFVFKTAESRATIKSIGDISRYRTTRIYERICTSICETK